MMFHIRHHENYGTYNTYIHTKIKHLHIVFSFFCKDQNHTLISWSLHLSNYNVIPEQGPRITCICGIIGIRIIIQVNIYWSYILKMGIYQPYSPSILYRDYIKVSYDNFSYANLTRANGRTLLILIFPCFWAACRWKRILTAESEWEEVGSFLKPTCRA